jgi:hypothetical protein
MTPSDGETRWKVHLPPTALVRGDKLIVPDENGEPALLTGWLLVEFAREGLFGLRFLSEEPRRM